MTLTAKVIAIRTTPYSDQEMNDLSPEEYSRVRGLDEEKVTGEEEIADIHAETEDDLRKSILDICKSLDGMPLIVLTDAFPDSFLVGRQYYDGDQNAIFESIQFHYNVDHPASIAKAKWEAQRKERPKLTPQQLAELEQTRGERIELAKEKIAEGMGLKTFDEYITMMKDSLAKAYQITSDQKEASRIAAEKHMRRWYEHGGQGTYVELWNPKKELEKTTILFRVIGKNIDANGNHLRYYSRLHNIEGFANIVNSLSGIPSASFRYPDNKI